MAERNAKTTGNEYGTGSSQNRSPAVASDKLPATLQKGLAGTAALDRGSAVVSPI